MMFVCCLFHGHGLDRLRVMHYGAEHVRVLGAMLRRNGGHTLVCVTDKPTEIEGVAVLPMPIEASRLPGFYPKLWLFSEGFGAWAYQRTGGVPFVAIDLDAVILADPAPALPTGTDFAIWDEARGEPYNTSLYLLRPGARSIVWAAFSVERALVAERVIGAEPGKRWTGDQSWVAAVLGEGERTFNQAGGIIRYKPSRDRPAPAPGARVYFMCGPFRPDIEARDVSWVAEAYQ